MNNTWIDKANRVFVFVLIAQLVITIITGFITDTLILGLSLGLPIIVLPLILISQMPHSRLTRQTLGIAVQLATALHIQQTMGLIEMHFEIFVVLAFLSIFRDWRVILTSTLVVAVHHVLFFILESQGMGVYVLGPERLSFGLLLLHAFFAVAEGAVLMYIARVSHREADASQTIAHQVQGILQDPEKVNLGISLNTSNRDLKQFNRLITELANVVTQSKDVSSQVEALSSQVNHESEEVGNYSEAVSQQASTIATAIEELTTTINDVSSQADQANDESQRSQTVTNEAKAIIESSNQEVNTLKVELSDTTDVVSKLAERCDQIVSVMDSIKTISEQTNLLALNAAIESARAGEHGRGFAVVADEVRQLAIKTRQNVESIATATESLIADANQSVKQMNICMSRVETAGESSIKAVGAMDTVSNSIVSVSGNIAAVATAAQEQTNVANSITHTAQTLHDTSVSQLKRVNKARELLNNLGSNINTLTRELNKFSS